MFWGKESKEGKNLYNDADNEGLFWSLALGLCFKASHRHPDRYNPYSDTLKVTNKGQKCEESTSVLLHHLLVHDNLIAIKCT